MFEFFFSLHVSFNDRIECIYNIDLPTTHLRHHRDLFVSLNVLNHFNLVCCIISFLLACFLLLLFLSQIVTLMRVRGLENVLKRETRTCKLLCAHIHICVCVQHGPTYKKIERECEFNGEESNSKKNRHKKAIQYYYIY